MSLQDQIIQAIREHRVTSIMYGGHREIEPHIMYESSTHKTLVDAYQRSGYSESGEPVDWKSLEVNKIASVRLHGEMFNVRSGYNPDNRKRYRRIIAKV